jgi:anthranilate 1,2-dioxygenase small subunit
MASIAARIADLQTRYVRCLDERRLDEWPDLFVDACVYRIVSRDNHVRGLPMPLMLCHGKGMLKDRAYAFQHINIYPVRVDRHLVANMRVEPRGDRVYRVEADYVVLQTDGGGLTSIFSAGRYLDTVVDLGGEVKFQEKVVVSDTCVITTALCGPL